MNGLSTVLPSCTALKNHGWAAPNAKFKAPPVNMVLALFPAISYSFI